MQQEQPFTLGFRDAMAQGIDYRHFEKVRALPEAIELTAVAGIWGNYSDLRCLFTCSDGTQICRTVWSRSKYFIPELQIHGKEIRVGQRFTVQPTTNEESHETTSKEI